MDYFVQLLVLGISQKGQEKEIIRRKMSQPQTVLLVIISVRYICIEHEH